MAPLLPQPGQVIRYAYLWWSESRVGREDGAKDRPCGVILTRITKAGNTVAYDFTASDFRNTIDNTRQQAVNRPAS